MVELDTERRKRRVISRALGLGLASKPKSCPHCRLRHRPKELVGELASVSPLKILWSCRTCDRKRRSALLSAPPEMPRHASRVRRAREARGLTQAELSQRTGITPQTISRVETGAGSPSRKTLSRLALSLGVEPAYLW